MGALALPAGRLVGNRESSQIAQRQLAAGQGADSLQHVTLAMTNQRDGQPLAASPSGTTDAVYVDRGAGGQVQIDHYRQRLHMDAARHQVGGHQHPNFALFEIAERLLAHRLLLLAMKGGHRNARLGQLSGHTVGIIPRTDKDQHLRPCLLLEQADERRYLAALVDQIEPLFDLVHHAVEGGGLDTGRLAQQAVGQRLQLGRQGGGEEQGLAIRRNKAE